MEYLLSFLVGAAANIAANLVAEALKARKPRKAKHGKHAKRG